MCYEPSLEASGLLLLSPFFWMRLFLGLGAFSGRASAPAGSSLRMSLAFSMRRILGFGRCLWMWRFSGRRCCFSRRCLRMWSSSPDAKRSLAARRSFRDVEHSPVEACSPSSERRSDGRGVSLCDAGVLLRLAVPRSRNVIRWLSRWRLCRRLRLPHSWFQAYKVLLLV